MSDTKPKITFEDYRKAMEERGKSDSEEMPKIARLLLLWCFVVTLNIILFLFSQDSFIKHVGERLNVLASTLLVPYFIASIVFTIFFVFFAVGLFKSLRCPKCRRLFPKGKLELYTSQQSTDLGFSSEGDTYVRPSHTHVYWTPCKHCGHIIWVIK